MNQLLLEDDNALVAESAEKLNELTSEFWKVFHRSKLKINIGESNVIGCSTSERLQLLKLKLHVEELEVMKMFEYLGINSLCE